MPTDVEAFVFDTSALLCLKENEEGAGEVEEILRHYGKKGQLYVSFMSVMELAYILEQELGESEARRGVLQFKQLPVTVIESDEELGLAAARIKAAHRLSLADAWVAATAQRLGAVLVHKDPEFAALNGIIQMRTLPLKAKGKA